MWPEELERILQSREFQNQALKGKSQGKCTESPGSRIMGPLPETCSADDDNFSRQEAIPNGSDVCEIEEVVLKSFIEGVDFVGGRLRFLLKKA